MRALIIAAAMMVAVGCGASSMEAARRATGVAAVAIDLTDRRFHAAYDRARDVARAENEDRAGRDRQLLGWEAAKEALYTADNDVRDLAEALETVEAGGVVPWKPYACSLADALGRLRAALRDLDLPIAAGLSGAEAAFRRALNCGGPSP